MNQRAKKNACVDKFNSKLTLASYCNVRANICPNILDLMSTEKNKKPIRSQSKTHWFYMGASVRSGLFMQPSALNSLMLLTNWLSCHGGALHSNNEDSHTHTPILTGIQRSLAVRLLLLVTISEGNWRIFIHATMEHTEVKRLGSSMFVYARRKLRGGAGNVVWRCFFAHACDVPKLRKLMRDKMGAGRHGYFHHFSSGVFYRSFLA